MELLSPLPGGLPGLRKILLSCSVLLVQRSPTARNQHPTRLLSPSDGQHVTLAHRPWEHFETVAATMSLIQPTGIILVRLPSSSAFLPQFCIWISGFDKIHYRKASNSTVQTGSDLALALREATRTRMSRRLGAVVAELPDFGNGPKGVQMGRKSLFILQRYLAGIAAKMGLRWLNKKPSKNVGNKLTFVLHR